MTIVGWINSFFAIQALKIHEEEDGGEKKIPFALSPISHFEFKNWSHRSCASAEFHVQRKALLIYSIFSNCYWPPTSILEFICRHSLCQLTFFTSYTLFHTDVLTSNALTGRIVSLSLHLFKRLSVGVVLFSEPVSVLCSPTFNNANICNWHLAGRVLCVFARVLVSIWATTSVCAVLERDRCIFQPFQPPVSQPLADSAIFTESVSLSLQLH